jgi:predicted nucleotidyltransferase
MITPAQQAPQSPAATAAVIQAVATAVGEALSARCVILFGSRARGDHHEWSDVDLAVILGGAALDSKQRRDAADAAIELARSTANARFRRIDVIVWTEEEYRLKKRSVNHVAGRAWREALTWPSYSAALIWTPSSAAMQWTPP